MLMEPIRSNGARQQTATVQFVPPPIGGWNARDDLTDMKPSDAIVLDNWFPKEDGITQRSGYTSHVTGLPSAVITLMEYSGWSGTPKLFAATASAIYDVTTAGAVGAAAVSALSNGRWQRVMFTSAGAAFLIAVNGADGVRSYNGTAWATETITGVSAANLVTVTVHMKRLWFIEENSLKVWYLPVDSKSGAATSFNFESISALGGKLMAMATWTRDSGAGLEDLAAFITSEGEVHIFSGTDPASTATWTRVGTYRIPEPIGRKCWIKAGGDVGVLTTQGVVPLSGVLSRAESAQSRVAITDKIRSAYSEAYANAATANGWEQVEWPTGKMIIVHVPIVENTSAQQFVMNSNTGAWCRFIGLPANCWCVFGIDMYFGGVTGTVWRFSGATDNGALITATALSAFGNLGTERTKTFKRVRPQFFGPAGYRPSIGLAVDYSDQVVSFAASSFDTAGTAWDVGDWDTSPWAASAVSNSYWQGMVGEGFVGALQIQVAAADAITFNGYKVLFEVGDSL